MTHVSSHVSPILLAGGSGTRLWPLSRQLSPKHILNLSGDGSLLQQTARRVLRGVSPERVITVTHENHRFEVKNQLAEVSKALGDRVLAEPVARNTLPAIAWAVASLEDPEALIAVFPSDHLIYDDDQFLRDLQQAVDVAQQGYMVTLGIRPDGPETGYGYMEAGAPLDDRGTFHVLRFVEKPDFATAREYVQKGNFFWNAGIFIFQVKQFQEEVRRREPTIYEASLEAARCQNDPVALKKIYEKMKSISIDYGVMEKAERVAVIPARFRWSDLGSWEAVYKSGRDTALSPNPSSVNSSTGSFAPFGRPDQVRSGQYSLTDHLNVTRGDVIALDTENSLLVSEKGLIATIGLKDMVVIKTGDAVLVSPRNRVQDVKKLVEKLKEERNSLVESHATVTRPWGQFTNLEEGPGFKVKRIIVNPGQKLSLQSHESRSEHWVVIEGTAKVTNGDQEFLLQANESTFIPMGAQHRLENPSEKPLAIIEVQVGSYLGEDDIKRYDDIYGR